jgi:hypothetical protein
MTPTAARLTAGEADWGFPAVPVRSLHSMAVAPSVHRSFYSGPTALTSICSPLVPALVAALHERTIVA